MSHIVLRKWKELQQNVEQRKNSLTTRSIVDLLLNWSKEIQLIKDAQIQNLYDDYLKYFENLNVEDILYVDDHVWYSLKDVIQFDILQPKINTYERAITQVRDVLFNLLIFKSDKNCPCHGDDNLRVFVEAGSEKLILNVIFAYV
ncbi:hypothetical protein HX13_22595 [Chryseobacterium sp. P1-3]|uniref:hypothetical protein n=1 Tax=Chryseobacterium sp. (strain P1-3) TaxID=1517683 RepID=UPI0004E73177|nr:hypothetical protein [Chryseobacterium sp. P1-3]KFF73164.1 hypothetical protein HX13_22595 [Chryseobacterium sp. P1-3]